MGIQKIIIILFVVLSVGCNKNTEERVKNTIPEVYNEYNINRLAIANENLITFKNNNLYSFNISSTDTFFQLPLVINNFQEVKNMHVFNNLMVVSSNIGLKSYKNNASNQLEIQTKNETFNNCNAIFLQDSNLFAISNTRNLNSCKNSSAQLYMFGLNKNKILWQDKLNNPYSIQANQKYVVVSDEHLKLYQIKSDSLLLLQTYPVSAYQIFANDTNIICFEPNGISQYVIKNNQFEYKSKIQ